ncbi:hypothetical protein B0T24DRAFT_629559 [Lasiosphaeria ovina]|uniref:GPI inositol-deacylase winged helix domain-containing protein n=1 Tax=Lasiosphaeria ovina TaxID=92902 RepID=A0AAE0N6T5_9PEZI|nr:hypothetical protein B0T24DRAFT_629559 [Lasiosphaeria ovina]
MERVEGQAKDQESLAKQALSWITCVKRPPTTLELQHALAVELGRRELRRDNISDAEDIISVCAGLVTVDEESSVIRLVHYTTQEYLERTQCNWFPEPESDITTTCLTYLLFDAFEDGICHTDSEFDKSLQLNPLYEYAARSWGHHARKSSKLCHLFEEFAAYQAKAEAVSQALMVVKDYPEDLYIIVRCF